ncbi:GntR family transcriptional regulator [Streptomyces scopuliridis]|uniref:GntR family transcriptional regulator n=1 Tax=Streptomyces scopuliridis TaxID=452529 RepID=UPI0036A437B6
MANRYQHVADDLRRLITTGALSVGERLPAEQELALRYKVSTPTLRNALEVLQSEGLVEKRHGSGNFIRRPGQRITYANDRHEAGRSPVPGVAVSVSLETALVEADAQLSLLLAVRAGSPLAEYAFISCQGTSPRSLARVYVPHAVARLGVPDVNESPWGDSVRQLLSGAGVRVTAIAERVTARFPTAWEAHTLHISTRAPVLAVERTSTDASDRVVEAALLVLPGDRTDALFTKRSVTQEVGAAG